MQATRWLIGLGIMVAAMVCLLDQERPLEGCAPAPHPGQWVDIRDESALIIWDEVAKTEHFIRRASFETKADDFGFLVPTPTQPELGESDDRVFETLGRLTAARHVYQTKVETRFGFGDLLPQSKMMAPQTGANPPPNAMAGAVEVLDQKEVAGFDATVLKADDAEALAEWLDKHGYEARPALTEWLKWYVDNKWIITAFKMVKGQRPTFDAKAVRMTFQTEKPFYPYREPTDMRNPSGQGSRTLRVFVLSDKKYSGSLGENGQWPGESVWANNLAENVNQLRGSLKLGSDDASFLPDAVKYLTEFQDRSFPRPGTDEVYFAPAPNQASQERPPIVHTSVHVRYWPGPIGALVLLFSVPAIALLAFVRWIWRSPSAEQTLSVE